jgi:hypothetical protein
MKSYHIAGEHADGGRHARKAPGEHKKKKSRPKPVAEEKGEDESGYRFVQCKTFFSQNVMSVPKPD